MIVLLWVILVVALIATLIACGWMLVRKFIALLEAIGDLLVKPAILDGVHRGEPEVRPLSAVLESRSMVAARYADQRTWRRERRLERHSARLERARALIASQPRALN